MFDRVLLVLRVRVIAGEFSCGVSPDFGQAFKSPIRLTVEPNAEADAGNSLLDDRPRGWGTVTGTLRYPDGSLVEGQTLLNVYGDNDPYMGIFSDIFIISPFNTHKVIKRLKFNSIKVPNKCYRVNEKPTFFRIKLLGTSIIIIRPMSPPSLIAIPT